MYLYLKEKEGQYTVPSNYLAGTRTTGKMRTVLLDWLVDVQQQFKLLPETLYLTISIIDRLAIYLTIATLLLTSRGSLLKGSKRGLNK